MPQFLGALWNPTRGRHVKTVRANTQQEADDIFRSENNFVIDVAESKTDGFVWKPKFREEKMELYRELANTIATGSVKPPMYRELILPTFEKGKKFYPIADGFLSALASEVMWRAMERYPQAFDEYEVNLIQTAGASDMVETLRMMVETLDQQNKLARQIGKMLFWPAAMTVGLVIVMGTFLAKLLPQMKETAEAIPGTVLPPPLPQILAVEDFFLDPHHTLLIIAIGLVVALAGTYAGASKRGRYFLDSALLKAGLYGRLVRLTRVLQVFFLLHLMQRGTSQYLAYDYAVGAAVGPVFRDQMIKVREAFHDKKYPTWPENLLEAKDVIGATLIRKLKLAHDNSMLKEELAYTIGRLRDDITYTSDKFQQWLQITLTTVYGGVLGGILYLVIIPLQSFIAHMR